MKLIFLALLSIIASSCSSTLYTRDQNGKLVYTNPQSSPFPDPRTSTPYSIFASQFAGFQPEIAPGVLDTSSNSLTKHNLSSSNSQTVPPLTY